MRRLFAALTIMAAAIGIGGGTAHATPTGCHRYLDTGYPPGNWSIVYCSTLSDLGYPGGPFDAIASTIDYK